MTASQRCRDTAGALDALDQHVDTVATPEQFAVEHHGGHAEHAERLRLADDPIVFRRFWSHDLEIDELADISGLIASVGGSARDFEAYVHGPARAEHDRIIDEAETLGVFGVPTMVFNGELFWGGDRIDMLIERIGNPEGIAAALGSRHRK